MSKKMNSKENNINRKKKDKKKKSILRRIIKFILICILIVALCYAGWFGYKYYQHAANMDGSNYDPLSAVALGIDPNKLKDIGRINILVLGESGVGDGYKLADSIMVVSYSPQTQQATLLSIPRDTYVGKKSKDTASQNYLASYKMNAVYRNGTNIPETIECVNNLTGLNLDKYILLDTDMVIQMVDAVGGIWFDVPIDMEYDDPTQDLHIKLSAGYQLIDGEKAEQLLRFRHNNDGTTYSAEYGEQDIGRMRTQREFIQETAKQVLKLENVTKLLNIMEIVLNNVETNLVFEEMKYYIPYVFKFSTQNIQSEVLPGEPELCNGVWIYTANKTKTKSIIEELFTDKVLEDNTNTSEESNLGVTVELLNGTGDSTILSEVKTKLEREGYTISKTGTTSSTSKTSIVNRSNKSTNIEEDLKEILGVGTISNGYSNTGVDFTIIIGKDYK